MSIRTYGSTFTGRSYVIDDRYAFDWSVCTYAKGWAQVDTYQDASYFGIWTNPEQRMTVTYAEGDVSVVIATNDADYRASVVELLRVYTQAEQTAMIDANLDGYANNPLRDRFVRLGMASYLH